MITKTRANPVELAVAAAFISGQLDAKSVPEYAKKLAATLSTEGLDTTGWESAVRKWTGAEQSVQWRAEAAQLLSKNQPVLDQLANAVEEIARIPSASLPGANAKVLSDWLFQQGVKPDGSRMTPAEIVADPAFFDKGRFAAYPSGVAPPITIGTGKKGKGKFPISVGTEHIDSPAGKKLSDAMTTQWGFLQNRGVEGGLNVNTLNRHAYNEFGVQQILSNLRERGVKDGRVLLVTGYETPLHLLLESDRVKEIVVADLSENAAKVIAEKYAGHPNARKLKIEVMDFSGISLEAQAKQAERFAGHGAGEVPAEITRGYFEAIAKPENLVALPFESNGFDAIHLPFVSGSFHLGAVTQAISAQNKGHIGYDDYLGADNLATPEARKAVLSTDKHVFDESLRMTKEGGLVVVNMWARPQPDSPEAPIRFSDTPVTRQEFSELTSGMEHWFSGNPQPTLLHTVGHIMAATKHPPSEA